jgi:hypothetical protein
METQRALVADYATHVARFDAIAEYLARRQPAALMVWGRHDAFFDVAETLSGESRFSVSRAQLVQTTSETIYSGGSETLQRERKLTHSS